VTENLGSLAPPWIVLGIVLGAMLLVWLLSLVRRDASIVDIFWGLGFVLCAWLYFSLGQATTVRSWLVPVLVTIWGARLSSYIFLRNRGKGEDYRYREMRERCGARFAWVSLFQVFLLQGVLLWLIALPLWAAQRSSSARGLVWIDGLALALFAVGLFFETVGDWQLARFKADPAHRGRVLRDGLWRYTRHPNYFGDALVWWGLFGFALATPGGGWTVFSPVLMTVLLLEVSGVALLEKKQRRDKPEYRDYIERTNAFFPWWPKQGPGG
jgi:steroid 5-alpha reductase family enzyme